MEFAFHGANFLAAVIIFRKYLATSWNIPHATCLLILRQAFLGAFLAWLANLLTNDLIFYYLPKYFYYDDFGPHFYNVLKQNTLAAQLEENKLLTSITIVFLVPIWEEVFHRGLIFGTLYRKNIAVAYIVSILLYAFLPLVSLLGEMPTDYIIISFLQYIPISVMFAWIYTQTESIFCPILAHFLLNGLSILVMI
jgi:membrane protease YdiL (CAAX protease family)